MKKILIINLLSFLVFPVAAQNIYNGDFALNSGNNGASCGVWNTFADGSVPNWLRSHGTPNFNVSNSGFGVTNDMVLWKGGPGTEGILGGYAFSKYRSYCVKVNLSGWTAGGEATDQFYVYAVSNLQRNLTLDNLCTSTTPNLPFGAELIGIGSKQSVNYFPFSPMNNNSQIYIVFTQSTGNWDAIAISDVIIESFCRENITFSNGTILPDTYSANHIYAGTSFGSGGATVTNDPTAQTTLKGGTDVIMQDDFVASAQDGGTFVATIEPCYQVLCSRAIGKSAEGAENPRRIDLEEYAYSRYIGSKRFMSGGKLISISPNPAHDYFNVGFKESTGKFTIKVSSVEGKIVLNQQASGTAARVDISALAPGMYFVEISDGVHQSVQRLVKP